MCAEGTDRRLPVLAVLGAAAATPEQEPVALAVGRLAARHGWVVLTGGGPGVMAAASRGAVETGGLTVGVLPVARATVDYPNPWVRIPVFTGAGMARNAFNVLSGTLCVAIGGGAGTLSEVALALKAGVEVWWWGGGGWRRRPARPRPGRGGSPTRPSSWRRCPDISPGLVARRQRRCEMGCFRRTSEGGLLQVRCTERGLRKHRRSLRIGRRSRAPVRCPGSGSGRPGACRA